MRFLHLAAVAVVLLVEIFGLALGARERGDDEARIGLALGLFCPGPSSLNRPHPPHARAHRDFAARRPIRSRTAKAPRSRARAPGGVAQATSWRCHFMAVHDRACGPGKNGDPALAAECTKGGCTPAVATRMSGADLSEATAGKAPSERPALQPYRGQPALRNERGDRGNVGIIRSPLRASILPDLTTQTDDHHRNLRSSSWRRSATHGPSR
jgi:hypothetical protein